MCPCSFESVCEMYFKDADYASPNTNKQQICTMSKHTHPRQVKSSKSSREKTIPGFRLSFLNPSCSCGQARYDSRARSQFKHRVANRSRHCVPLFTLNFPGRRRRLHSTLRGNSIPRPVCGFCALGFSLCSAGPAAHRLSTLPSHSSRLSLLASLLWARYGTRTRQ